MATTEQAGSKEQAKITLHWLEESRSHRIVWLLEELGLEYDLKVYYRTKERLAPPELKEVHPLGKSPVLTIQAPGMEKPKVLVESAFIIEYLLDYYGQQLVPRRYPDGRDAQIGQETEEWTRYRVYMHYAEGSMIPPLTAKLISSGIRSAPLPFFLKPITRSIADQIDGTFNKILAGHFEYLESQIASSPQNGQFLCGPELTGADIMMIFPLDGSQSRAGATADKYPKLNAYIDRIKERPAYQKAIKLVEDATGKPFKAIVG